MYEKLKTDFEILLMAHYSVPEVEKIVMMLNLAAENYEVTERETGLVVYDPEQVPQLVQQYLVTKKIEGLSDATLDQYRLYLMKFFDSCRKSPEMVEKNDIILFLHRYKSERNVSDRSLDKVREYICRFFNWCCDEGLMERSPARTVKPIKHEVKEREGLTQLELEYVRNACKSLRDKAMVEVFYSTGCRVSELAILKKDDINFESGEVALFGKGKKHRTSFLNAKAKVALREYWMSRNDDCEYAFVTERATRPMTKDSIELAIRKISERSGISKKLTPHKFRHTTATQSLNSGMPVESIQMILGHASINTTMIYAKANKARVKAEHQRCVI